MKLFILIFFIFIRQLLSMDAPISMDAPSKTYGVFSQGIYEKNPNYHKKKKDLEDQNMTVPCFILKNAESIFSKEDPSHFTKKILPGKIREPNYDVKFLLHFYMSLNKAMNPELFLSFAQSSPSIMADFKQREESKRDDEEAKNNNAKIKAKQDELEKKFNTDDGKKELLLEHYSQNQALRKQLMNNLQHNFYAKGSEEFIQRFIKTGLFFDGQPKNKDEVKLKELIINESIKRLKEDEIQKVKKKNQDDLRNQITSELEARPKTNEKIVMNLDSIAPYYQEFKQNMPGALNTMCNNAFSEKENANNELFKYLQLFGLKDNMLKHAQQVFTNINLAQSSKSFNCLELLNNLQKKNTDGSLCAHSKAQSFFMNFDQLNAQMVVDRCLPEEK